MKIGKRFKKNILILLSDPGCISIIEYEINKIKKKYNTDIYLLNNYKHKNNAISKNIISNKIFLKNIGENKYKLILTGTTKKNIELKKLWLKLYDLKYEIHVFIDAIINIEERFKFKNKLLTKIFRKFYVIEEIVKKKLIKLNVHKNSIVKISHPLIYNKKIKNFNRNKNYKKIIFLSEPIYEYNETKKIGYNQYILINAIIIFLEKHLNKSITFLIKPHPLEEVKNLKKNILGLTDKNNKIKIKIVEKPIQYYYNKVDLCIGMATFGLIEFKFHNPNVLSIQMNRKYDPNPLLKKYKINTYRNLDYFLRESLKVVTKIKKLKSINISLKKINKLHNVIN